MLAAVIESTEQFLSGGGEMGNLIRTMDWSKNRIQIAVNTAKCDGSNL